MSTDDRWKVRIEALLRKAEDPATTAEERATIQDRVVYLMAKHGFDEAMFASVHEDKRTELVVRKYRVNTPHRDPKSKILTKIALTFGCRIVNTTGSHARGDHSFTVIGFEDDQERIYMLYSSVLAQMITECATAYENKPSHVHGRTFNSSFFAGFAIKIVERIDAAYRQAKSDAQTEHGSGMEVVLLDRKNAIKLRVKQEFPYGLRPGGAIRLNASSSSAYQQGVNAAARANIGQTTVSSMTRKAIG